MQLQLFFNFYVIIEQVSLIAQTLIYNIVLFRGCFFTSSLVGTMSLSLTIPLSILVDIVVKKVGNMCQLIYIFTFCSSAL